MSDKTIQVPACPSDLAGSWQYLMDTRDLIEENGKLINSWKCILPWNWRRISRNFAIIDARHDELDRVDVEARTVPS